MGYRGQSDRGRVTGSVEVLGAPTISGAVSVTGGTLGAAGTVSITGGTVGVTGTFWQATQPISGTVTVQDGGNVITVDVSGNLTDSDRAAEAGTLFSHSSKHAGVVAAASIDHLVVTPASPVTRLYDFTCTATGGPCDVLVYEGTTTSANGAAENVYNHSRDGSPATVLVYLAPTITTVGTEIKYVLIPGTKQDGGFGKSNGGHYVLKASTKYLIRVTNNSAGVQDICTAMTFKEG